MVFWAGFIPRGFIIGTSPDRPMMDLQSAYVPLGRYEDALASSTEPCGLDVLAVSAAYDLQSAEFLCFFIRYLRWALTVLSGFTSV